MRTQNDKNIQSAMRIVATELGGGDFNTGHPKLSSVLKGAITNQTVDLSVKNLGVVLSEAAMNNMLFILESGIEANQFSIRKAKFDGQKNIDVIALRKFKNLDRLYGDDSVKSLIDDMEDGFFDEAKSLYGESRATDSLKSTQPNNNLERQDTFVRNGISLDAVLRQAAEELEKQKNEKGKERVSPSSSNSSLSGSLSSRSSNFVKEILNSARTLALNSARTNLEQSDEESINAYIQSARGYVEDNTNRGLYDFIISGEADRLMQQDDLQEGVVNISSANPPLPPSRAVTKKWGDRLKEAAEKQKRAAAEHETDILSEGLKDVVVEVNSARRSSDDKKEKGPTQDPIMRALRKQYENDRQRKSSGGSSSSSSISEREDSAVGAPDQVRRVSTKTKDMRLNRNHELDERRERKANKPEKSSGCLPMPNFLRRILGGSRTIEGQASSRSL